MNKLKIAGMLLCMVCSICIISCNKNTEVLENENTNNSIDISEADLAVYHKVKDFRNNMIDSRKSSSTYSIAEFQTLLESTINYYYSKGSFENNFIGDSILTPFNNNTNEINEDEAELIYNEILHELGNQSRAIDAENVKLSFADIEIIEKDGIYHVLCIGNFGFNSSQKGAIVTGIYSGIGDDDFWWSVNNQGKCDTYDGQYEGIKDASDVIEEIVNPKIKHTIGINQYWDELTTIKFDYKDYPSTVNPNWDYRIFFYSNPIVFLNVPGWPCLAPSDIEYFSTELTKIITDFDNNTYKTCVRITGTYCYNRQMHWTLKYHKPFVYFGVPRTRVIEEADGDLFELP